MYLDLKSFDKLAQLVRQLEPNLVFTIVEAGARPISDDQEPFYRLLQLFPGSRIVAFEVDEALCKELNEKCPAGVDYFPVALGSDNEMRLLYETRHPMCSSLYQPDDLLNRSYNNLDVAMLKSVRAIFTSTLDTFMEQHGVREADFIKIDVQGAELDVFKGGVKTLQQVVCIVSEIEFIPMYVDQPLFGDVCSYLAKQGLKFHKFLGLAGRSMIPVVLHNDQNAASQQMWADAVFMRDTLRLYDLSQDKLLKMGLLAYLYGSPDISYHCFKRYDDMMGSRLHQAVLELS